jgi:hypothetical protein
MVTQHVSDRVFFAGCIPWSNMVEAAYLEGVTASLQSKWSLPEDVGVLILAFKSYVEEKSLGDLDELHEVLCQFSRWIGLYISDEGGGIPHALCERCDAVFKAYLPDKKLPPNLFHFPVGVANYEEVGQETGGKRKDINIFFFGNLNEQRMGLHKQLSGSILPETLYRRYVEWRGASPLDLSDRFSDSIIRFSRDWGGGMSPEVYHRTLGRSKIALCPAGFRTSETFRHFEALRAGCVVLSEPLPQNNPFYQTEAILEVDSYGEMVRVAERLLRHEARLDELMRASRDWWQEKCAPRAVADYIVSKAKSVSGMK